MKSDGAGGAPGGALEIPPGAPARGFASGSRQKRGQGGQEAEAKGHADRPRVGLVTPTPCEDGMAVLRYKSGFAKGVAGVGGYADVKLLVYADLGYHTAFDGTQIPLRIVGEALAARCIAGPLSDRTSQRGTRDARPLLAWVVPAG